MSEHVFNSGKGAGFWLGAIVHLIGGLEPFFYDVNTAAEKWYVLE